MAIVMGFAGQQIPNQPTAILAKTFPSISHATYCIFKQYKHVKLRLRYCPTCFRNETFVKANITDKLYFQQPKINRSGGIMSRSTLPSMLHIGSITVETHDLFLAREIAAVIRATQAPDTTDGIVSFEGRQFRWWRSLPNSHTSDSGKKRGITR